MVSTIHFGDGFIVLFKHIGNNSFTEFVIKLFMFYKGALDSTC